MAFSSRVTPCLIRLVCSVAFFKALVVSFCTFLIFCVFFWEGLELGRTVISIMASGQSLVSRQTHVPRKYSSYEQKQTTSPVALKFTIPWNFSDIRFQSLHHENNKTCLQNFQTLLSFPLSCLSSVKFQTLSLRFFFLPE